MSPDYINSVKGSSKIDQRYSRHTSRHQFGREFEGGSIFFMNRLQRYCNLRSTRKSPSQVSCWVPFFFHFPRSPQATAEPLLRRGAGIIAGVPRGQGLKETPRTPKERGGGILRGRRGGLANYIFIYYHIMLHIFASS